MRTLLKSENKSAGISFKVKSVNNVEHTVEGIFSAEVEDRQGEIVVQSGWLLDRYLKNPVVLWAHKSDEPPIAKMLTIGVNASTNQLEGKMQFAVNEYPFAQTIFNLIVGGYQKAFSAGFINNRYEIDEQNDKIYLLENELLEVSAVPVPANQLALAKARGIDIEMYTAKAMELGELPETPEEAEEDIDNDDDDDDGILTEEKALEHISKSNLETITRAISTLTGLLKERTKTDKAKAEVSGKVEYPAKTGGKKIPVYLFNKAIRELVDARKNYK